MEKKKTVQELVVNTNTVVGSIYAQVARVTVTNYEMTIEFAYIHPAAPTEGQSVSRITMPVEAGRELAKTILSLDKIFEKKKEGIKND